MSITDAKIGSVPPHKSIITKILLFVAEGVIACEIPSVEKVLELVLLLLEVKVI